MRLLQLTPLLTAAIALCSCGGDESGDRGTTAPPPAECTVADVVLEDQSCLPPGVDVCAEGFVADGLGGCVAVLPPEPCPFGLMAVPGDEVCREVAPCGAAPWGDIPVEASTQYVDASYAGTSTGSADQPWTSLQEAIEAAAPGAIVALATGVYPANLDVTKPVRLWGRCPTEVALDATGGLRFATGATGSELRGMAVMGGAVFVSDATLLIEQAWLHDGGDFPIDLADEGAPAEVTVRDSLIELARTYAVTVSGSVATLERSEIRATQPNGAGLYGGGVQARVDPSTGVRATVTLQGCHLSLHTEAGLSLFGADAIVRGTAIRDIAGSQQLASGSAASLQTLGAHRSNLWLDGSTVTRVRSAGIINMGADATIERTTVRWTTAQLADGRFGRGVLAQYQPGASIAPTLVLRRSLIDANEEGGVSLLGGTGVIEGVIVRDTQPRAIDGADGRGVSVQIEPGLGLDTSLELSYSLIERNREVGLFVGAAVVTAHHVIFRDTLPQLSDGQFGSGLMLQDKPETGARGAIALATTLVSNNHTVGIFAGGVDLTLFDTRIEGTLPRLADGLIGDGLSARRGLGPAVVDIQQSNISENTRAGVASFGSAVGITDTTLQCNAFALNGQDDGGPFAFTDNGGNSCGCDDATEDCKVQTTELVPPSPLD